MTTSGGNAIVIYGKNLGARADEPVNDELRLRTRVEVGGRECEVTSVSDLAIECIAPEGSGVVGVVADVAGQLSNAVRFAYDPPTIDTSTALTLPTYRDSHATNSCGSSSPPPPGWGPGSGRPASTWT